MLYAALDAAMTTFPRLFGYSLAVKDQLPERLSDSVCFRPLFPQLSVSYALVWKRTAVLSKTSRAFLDLIREIFLQL